MFVKYFIGLFALVQPERENCGKTPLYFEKYAWDLVLINLLPYWHNYHKTFTSSTFLRPLLQLSKSNSNPTLDTYTALSFLNWQKSGHFPRAVNQSWRYYPWFEWWVSTDFGCSCWAWRRINGCAHLNLSVKGLRPRVWPKM